MFECFLVGCHIHCHQMNLCFRWMYFFSKVWPTYDSVCILILCSVTDNICNCWTLSTQECMVDEDCGERKYCLYEIENSKCLPCIPTDMVRIQSTLSYVLFSCSVKAATFLIPIMDQMTVIYVKGVTRSDKPTKNELSPNETKLLQL